MVAVRDKAGAPCAAMVLTTAAVHAGASGGAVLSPSGELLAVVTSNTKHAWGAAPLPATDCSLFSLNCSAGIAPQPEREDRCETSHACRFDARMSQGAGLTYASWGCGPPAQGPPSAG